MMLALFALTCAASAGNVTTAAVDSDHDRMNDDRERECGFDHHYPVDALADPDRDGFSNLTEYLLGTDPDDAKSRPTLADNREKILAYWPLATNAVDALGANLVGKLKNGAGFSGSAVKLDGKNDYVNFGNSSALSVTGSISYCLWIKPEQSCGTSRVLGKFKTCGNSREYSVFIGPDDRLWTFFSDDGSANKGHSVLKATDKHVIRDRQWQHLGVTWDASNGVDGVSCYLNGKNLRLCDLISSDITSVHTGSADLTLGAYDIFSVGWDRRRQDIVWNSFKGYMSQLVLCRGALTDLELREIYMLGRTGDLKAWLDMDFDQDGMPDWWERKYFGDISQSADGDFDKDGLSNIEEYRHGTDPTKPDTDGDGMPDKWEVDHGLNPLKNDALLDRDGDGITNLQEYLNSLKDRDSDHDGLPDWWEQKYFPQTGHADPAADTDGDGWTNLKEYQMGTNPNDPSDGIIAIEQARAKIKLHWEMVMPVPLTFSNEPGSKEDLRDMANALNALSGKFNEIK